MSTSVAIETNDSNEDRLLSLSVDEEDGRKQTAQLIRFVIFIFGSTSFKRFLLEYLQLFRRSIRHLFYHRKVYCLLSLRILCLTVMECFAIYDESISSFFSGSGGAVVIFMIWLIQFILSGYTSLSDRLGPDKPSNQNRFIALNVMEGLVCAGAASNLYHSNSV